MDIVYLNDRRTPVTYTIHVTHRWDGTLEAFVENISDDPRSQDSVNATIARLAETRMHETNIHSAMLNRIDALMGAEAGSQEVDELKRLAAACEVYEALRFPARAALAGKEEK